MKSRVAFEAIATIGEYKDKVTGEKRKQFQKCGTVFESEDGRLSLKLDTIPVTPTWSGFFSLKLPQSVRAVHQNGAPAPSPTDESEDDAPF